MRSKKTKRGRPPLGRKAMTAAERQARRRQRLREIARLRLREEKQARGIGTYQPPKGYGAAKAELQRQGHNFERARRDFGFEEGVFVDGAFLGSLEVIAFAKLPPSERQHLLAEHRRDTKDFACWAVESYMAALRVSFDELRIMRQGRLEQTGTETVKSPSAV